MVNPVPVTKSQYQPAERVREIQPADSASIYKQNAQQSEQLGQQYEQRAFENNFIENQTAVTKGLQDISQKYPSNPAKMQEAIENFKDGFLENVDDTDLNTRLKAQIERNGMVEVAKATERHQTIIDDQARYGTFKSLDQLQTDMSRTATDLFSEHPEVRNAAGLAFQENMNRGQSLLNQRSADGTPLISGQARANYEFGLRDQAYTSAAQGWFSAQPNKLKAASDWLAGNVSVDLPNKDGSNMNVNLRKVMPASALEKADSNIMGLMRDQMAIENFQQGQVDKQNQAMATGVFTAQTVALQDPDPTKRPTLESIDSMRNVYMSGGMEKEYIALRRQVIGGEPDVEDGATRTHVMSLAMQGNDQARTIAIQGAADGRLKWSTVNEAMGMLGKTQGPIDNTLSFYSQQLRNTIMPEGQFVGPEKGKILADANINMSLQFQQEAQRLGRPPTIAEFKNVYDAVANKTSVIPPEQRIYGNTPSYIPNYMAMAPTSKADIDGAFKTIQDNFANKYKGQPNIQEKIQSDPDYLDGLRWYDEWKNRYNPTGGVSDK